MYYVLSKMHAYNGMWRMFVRDEFPDICITDNIHKAKGFKTKEEAEATVDDLGAGFFSAYIDEKRPIEESIHDISI